MTTMTKNEAKALLKHGVGFFIFIKIIAFMFFIGLLINGYPLITAINTTIYVFFTTIGCIFLIVIAWALSEYIYSKLFN